MFVIKALGRWPILLLLILLLSLSLRFWDLGILPNGLHWDEQDTGYQVYALLKTGKDYFGNTLPFFFHSLADFRTPVFIYSNVPSVALFGLSVFSVRFFSGIMGLIGVILMYLLGRKITGSRWGGIIAALVMALSPWHVQYSRQSVETLTMVTYFLAGVLVYLRGQWALSGLLFGLTLAGYSPAKLFVPLFLLFNLPLKLNKQLFLFLIIFLGFFVYITADNFWGKSGLRFGQLSVFTDPTTATDVNWQRHFFDVALHPDQVGLQPGIIEKLIYNRPVSEVTSVVINYLHTFSPEFLFIKGDSELRHSPKQDGIGMLHLVEVIPLIIGLYVLPRHKYGKLLLTWLLLAPLPAAITRDGGTHAARLLILLPALLLTITLGIYTLFKRSKFLGLSYLVLLIFSALSIFGYFFSVYRWESAVPFQYGFDQAIRLALNNQTIYSRIVLDGKDDTLLMAYLFNAKYPPAKLQPLTNPKVYGDQEAYIFDNIYIMRSGGRNWPEIWRSNPSTGHELFIISAKQGNFPLTSNTIYYPDRSTPAFYVVER